jgi:colicin import membrane protein
VAQQETSALFSLKELMRLEESRIREEEERARQRVETAARARREAERLAAERKLAEMRAAEDRVREADARRREEAARLEALRAAEIERARVEAVERARAEALIQKQAHDEKLALLRASDTKKRLAWTAWISLALCITMVAAGALLYFGKWKPAAEARALEMQGIIDEQRARSHEMERSLDEQKKKAEEIEERLRAQREATPSTAPAPIPDKGPRVQRPVKPPPPKPTSCTCEPHDPICGCLSH